MAGELPALPFVAGLALRFSPGQKSIRVAGTRSGMSGII
jgi:hypothetical protein